MTTEDRIKRNNYRWIARCEIQARCAADALGEFSDGLKKIFSPFADDPQVTLESGMNSQRGSSYVSINGFFGKEDVSEAIVEAMTIPLVPAEILDLIVGVLGKEKILQSDFAIEITFQMERRFYNETVSFNSISSFWDSHCVKNSFKVFEDFRSKELKIVISSCSEEVEEELEKAVKTLDATGEIDDLLELLDLYPCSVEILKKSNDAG
jgi:hypothetical protein